MRKPIVAVPVFPGANCLDDTLDALHVVGFTTKLVWHTDKFVPSEVDGVFLAGGFSFADTLRPAVIASISKVMSSVYEFAFTGKPIVGICNGFQLLCESQLLPGILLENKKGQFVCDVVKLKLDHRHKLFGGISHISLPVAHRFGRYYYESMAYKEELNWPDAESFLYYCDQKGNISSELNGSENAIAGVVGGPQKNIIGMMPHPERDIERQIRLNSRKVEGDGLVFMRGIKELFKEF